MKRIYQNFDPNQIIELDKATAHRLTRVMRVGPKEELILFNGDGSDYLARIISISKQTVLLEIKSKQANKLESNFKIHLAQGIIKPDKMDLIVQKATELGTTEITPIICEFSQLKLTKAIIQKRHEHLQKTAIAACEQCGRSIIPKINFPIKITEFINQDIADKKLILHPYKAKPFTKSTEENITLLIGPEGGFSETEIAMATKKNFNPVTLGSRILRAETAAIVMIGILQYA